MLGPDTRDIDVLAGAMYFIVGRGTEGGPFPYHLTVTGITFRSADPNWGKPEAITANSGYSLGAIQVDLGQRGTWPLGATENAPLEPGQTTYVDGLIAEATKYAQEHHLKFTPDGIQLRTDLLTHGNGEGRRGTLVFIDVDTRDSINAWASSADGQRWIHRNMDYPQIRGATKVALDMVDADGRNISEDRRLETIAILVKTANQVPAQMAGFRQILQSGGSYEQVLAKANAIHSRHNYYGGPKAATLTERYKTLYEHPEAAAALDRAHAKVANEGFDPSSAAVDPDVQTALKAIGQAVPAPVLRLGSRGDSVASLQTSLAGLGITDAHGRALHPDGAFGPSTQAAVETFQRAHGLKPDGLVGALTLETLHAAARQQNATLADRSHPGNRLFCQALQGVHLLDAQCGRSPDILSANLAGALATAAHGRELHRIDHVLLGENATRAFAVQGDVGSPLKQIACVDVREAVAKPLDQSSAEFRMLPPPGAPQQAERMQAGQAHAQPSPANIER